MSVDLELAPKTKRAAGERCCEPVVYPDVSASEAQRMAEVAKALGDPIRLQLVDVLRKHAGKVCVCELVPLFDISQPTLSHHLKKLRDAGIVDSERQGLWAYYYVIPDALRSFRMAELTDRGDLRPTESRPLLRARGSRLLRAGPPCDAYAADGRATRAAADPSDGGSAAPARRSSPTRRRGLRRRPLRRCLAGRAARHGDDGLARLRQPDRGGGSQRARRSSIWAPVAASTSSSPPGGSVRPARRTVST